MRKELLNRIQTDTSGKWINLENAEKLIDLTIEECIKQVRTLPEDYDERAIFNVGVTTELIVNRIEELFNE